MSEFYNLMQNLNLADRPIWTISDKHKRPVNAKKGLAYHFDRKNFSNWFELARDPADCLVTLTELYQEPNTPPHCLALHVDLDQQNIAVIDIEKEYDKTVNQYLRKMPVVYGETSRHGGAHYVLPLPNDIIKEPKYQPLFIRTELKFGQTHEPHSGVEIFFHNHYLTFTEKSVLIHHNNGKPELRYFLDYLLTQQKAASVSANTYITEEENIPTDALTIAQHALTPTEEKTIKKYIKKNTDPDISSREFKNIMRIAEALLHDVNQHFKDDPFKPYELIDSHSTRDPTMLTWALEQLARDLLEPRDKWNKQITGQTYLQYTCNKIMTIQLKNKLRKI